MALYKLKDALSWNLGEESLEQIKRVLGDTNLSVDLREKILDIVIYLSEDKKHEKTVSAFVDFVTDEGNYTAPGFDEFINQIMTRISNRDAYLRNKLDVISVARCEHLDFGAGDFYRILSEILQMKNSADFNPSVVKILKDFLENPIERGKNYEVDSVRTIQILDYVIKHGQYVFFVDINNDSKERKLEVDSTYDWTRKVLESDTFANIDDEHYERLILLSCQGSSVYFLYQYLMNKPFLTTECIESVIDYYYTMITRDCFNRPHSAQSVAELDQLDNMPLFNIVEDSRTDHEPYTDFMNRLAKIEGSKYPFSMAMLLKDRSLSQKNIWFAIGLIEDEDGKGDENKYRVWTNCYGKNGVYDGDGKELLAMAASSPVLLRQSDEVYRRVLASLNKICIDGNIYRNGKFIQMGTMQYTSYGKKYSLGKKLVDAMNAVDESGEFIYKDNFSRLQRLFDALNELEVDDNSHLPNYAADRLGCAIDFAKSSIACYFSDEQYDKVIDMIINSSVIGQASTLLEIFTNECIPYMDDEDFGMMMTFYDASSEGKKEVYLSLAIDNGLTLSDDLLNDFDLACDNAKIRKYIELANRCGKSWKASNVVFADVDESNLRKIGVIPKTRLRRRTFIKKEKVE